MNNIISLFFSGKIGIFEKKIFGNVNSNRQVEINSKFSNMRYELQSHLWYKKILFNIINAIISYNKYYYNL